MPVVKFTDPPARRSAADLRSEIRIHDEFLTGASQAEVLNFLKRPGWAFGAYSDPAANASRYWYKHFAGYVKDGREARTAEQIEQELAANAPVLSGMWATIKRSVLRSHRLSRCYVNGYPFGAEGGVHYDSNLETHYTALYYPHLQWHPNYSGETVFFDLDHSDIIASVYPKPNRLLTFPGTIPHVARGVSRTCPDLRMTLMFKTTGPDPAAIIRRS